MNCQHETEHEGQKHPASSDQALMELPDYLHLASFIHYLRSGQGDTLDPENTGVVKA